MPKFLKFDPITLKVSDYGNEEKESTKQACVKQDQKDHGRRKVSKASRRPSSKHGATGKA